jgi:hypothetical protein
VSKKPAANIALAIWPGDEYILSFLFAIQFRFRQTNNGKHKMNNELLYIYSAAV